VGAVPGDALVLDAEGEADHMEDDEDVADGKELIAE
jgi:hypothetical protein